MELTPLPIPNEMEGPRRFEDNPKSQFSLLMRKNAQIYTKNWKSTMFQILTPLIICLTILFWQKIVDSMTFIEEQEPPIKPLMKFPKCTGKDCISLAYAIIVFSPTYSG